MASGYNRTRCRSSEEDVPNGSFLYIKLEKRSFKQLRRWFACRGIKRSGNKTSLLEIKKTFEVTNTPRFASLHDTDSDAASGDAKLS